MRQGISRRDPPPFRSSVAWNIEMRRGVSGVKNGPTSTSPAQNADASNPPPLIETPTDPGLSRMTSGVNEPIRPRHRKTRDGCPSVWIGRRGTLRCLADPEEDWEYGRNLRSAGGGFTPPGVFVAGKRTLTLCAHRITPWCVLPVSWRGTIPLADLGSQPRRHPSLPNPDGSGRPVHPRWTRAPAAASRRNEPAASCAKPDCSAYAVAPLRSLPATAKMRSTTPRLTP